MDTRGGSYGADVTSCAPDGTVKVRPDVGSCDSAVVRLRCGCGGECRCTVGVAYSRESAGTVHRIRDQTPRMVDVLAAADDTRVGLSGWNLVTHWGPHGGGVVGMCAGSLCRVSITARDKWCLSGRGFSARHRGGGGASVRGAVIGAGR